MDALLEVRDLKIAFDSPRGVIRAVRGVSFSLCAGETLAVVGESGCGKSVLCKSLLGLLPHRGRVAGGSILYAGRDLAAMGERELEGIRGKEIALVLQNPMSALNPSLPVGSQIARAARAHGGISRAGAKARALELMALTGISEPARRYGDYPHQFSGGMLQRCVLASALACGPKLLVADEPTTALDATVQAQMLDLLRDIQHQTGTAILFITHDLGAAARIAGRVAVMYAGKLVEIGAAEEIYHDPRHPYTWGLLASVPSPEGTGELFSIPGAPPDLLHPPAGDAFAPRNPWALGVDWREEPPLFRVSDTHYAATWLLHPDAPRVDPPAGIGERRVSAGG
ncbi:ABC transporter ATP-binding protein [Anaerotruncus sp. DFI.9.16]|uniref:ABC transporter ATP-binding protein n=1 Tax=Anaerotruncus sp. DFI.9.16 TaxID=2965275 RepID=UPI0027300550|nr:ABC transporter ATP-binding protein [Anaerotruncus sp. DFI.9.16]